MLKDKKILLGVSASIAAYKTPILVRLLVKKGAQVKVMMTPAASDFVTPLTLSTVSGYPVGIEYFDRSNGEWENHVEWGIWPDIIVIAPASANTLAKMAQGQADNFLMATYLSARCPVFFAPAMDLDMYKHPSVKDNIRKLQSYGNLLIHPGTGELASGLTGEGRMEEPEQIVAILEQYFSQGTLLEGKKVLVTAGPTYESIDPVRFIGNHSSGKMGIEIANRLAGYGAEVILVCGPSSVKHLHPGVKRVDVTSAQEMFDAVTTSFETADAAILAAAVADYRPKSAADKKIKKNSDEMSLDLVKNPDILATLGSRKKDHQVLVGFALETDNELENARTKLLKKNLDFIVLNSLRDEGAGFQKDTNKITIIDKDNNVRNFELKTKSEVAADIVDTLTERLLKK